MADDPISYRVLGFKVTPMTGGDIIELMAGAIAAGRKIIVASLNLHGMYVYLDDPVFRAMHDRDDAYVHIDGTPLIWLSQFAGLPVGMRHRTGVMDWLRPMLARAKADGWRVFYLGSDAGACAAAMTKLGAEFPGVELNGRDGYFDAAADGASNRAVVDEINGFRPHILLVGMGMGRQERWISENLDRLQINCVITIGASMEYVAGTLPLAPRWLGPIGMEWTFRLLSSPRRTAWRYLVEPWLIVWMLLRNRLTAAISPKH